MEEGSIRDDPGNDMGSCEDYTEKIEGDDVSFLNCKPFYCHT